MKTHYVTLPTLPKEELTRISETPGKTHYEIEKIMALVGQKVRHNEILGSFNVFQTSSRRTLWKGKIMVTIDGTIKFTNVKKGSIVMPG